MPFYEGLKTLDYMLVVRTCTQASLGDGVISVLAYWSAVLIARSRNWIHEISITPMIAYLAVRAKYACFAAIGYRVVTGFTVVNIATAAALCCSPPDPKKALM